MSGIHRINLAGIGSTISDKSTPLLDWGIYCKDSSVEGPSPSPYNNFAHWEAQVGKIMPIKPLNIWTDQITWSIRYPLMDAYVGSVPMWAINLRASNADTVAQKKTWLPHTWTDGDHDAWLTELANDFIEFGKPIWLRIWAESNNVGTMPTMCWRANIKDEDGVTVLSTPADWVEGWQYIHDFMESAGADNILWFWSMLSWPSGSYAPVGGANTVTMASLYPGDDYVDAIGIEFYPPNFTPTASTLNPYLDAYITGAYAEACALSATKPIMFAEGSCYVVDGHPEYKTMYLHNALSAREIITHFPRVTAVMAWDSQVMGLGLEDTAATQAAVVNAFKNALYK